MNVRHSERGAIHLTLAGRLLIMIVGLAVLGYVAWMYRDKLPFKPGGPKSTTGTASQRDDAQPSGNGAAPAAQAGVLARVRNAGVLRVGMEPDAAPLHFVNDRKQEDGFDFRLAGVIAEALKSGTRVQVVEADYEDLPGKLTSGEIDLIMAGYVPDPSIEGVDWSNGYLDFGLCLIVQEGMVSQYRSPADLAGKRIAIYDDPAAERWVESNIPNARISKFSGDSGWFEAVENGDAEALIYDYPFAAEEIKEHPRTVIVRYNLNSSKYAVGIPKGNYDLVYEVNQAIENFKGTPAYTDLMREYLSSSSEVFMKAIPGKKTYTVKPGDTLSLIAQRELGNTGRWREIWDLNRDRVANENLIYPRLVLVMP
jgi:ABC-type amino acid transport substrate-binding protein